MTVPVSLELDGSCTKMNGGGVVLRSVERSRMSETWDGAVVIREEEYVVSSIEIHRPNLSVHDQNRYQGIVTFH